MELQPSTYYDLSKTSPTFTLVQMAFETYFANNLMRSDASRIIYASEEYAFRQRLNLLSKNNNPSISELKLPFMRYFRRGNWQIDNRVGVQNATAGMDGFSDESIGFQKLRFLQCQTFFDCTLYFSRDDDAQLAYETLVWIQNPAPQQFNYGSVQYKGYSIELPMLFEVEDIQWMPTYNETEWLQKAHIIPISFSVHWRSAIMSQSPQSKESSTFWDDASPVITKRVYLDFLSYKFKNSYYDQSNYSLEVEGTFNPDPELLGAVSTQNVTTTSMSVVWTYNPEVEDLYTENVIVNVNGVDNYTVPMVQHSYDLSSLSPASQYTITVWFTSKSGQVTKYVVTTFTEEDAYVPTIPGIIGYTS